MVPSGWTGAGRLRPKPSRPRPLTLRPAPQLVLAAPDRPLQPQLRRREVYLSRPSQQSPGALPPPQPLRLYDPPSAPPPPCTSSSGARASHAGSPKFRPRMARARTPRGGSSSAGSPVLGRPRSLFAPPTRPALLKGNTPFDPAPAETQGLVSISTSNTPLQSTVSLAWTAAIPGASCFPL